jgi:hypothetical protein
MKGVVIALVMTVILSCLASGNPPLKEPLQYEQLCNDLKIAGNGSIDMSTSMTDKRISLEYINTLAGNGLVEMDQERVYSQAANKITKNYLTGNDSVPAGFNFIDNSKVTYSSKIPLIGNKYIRSKEFYGGIGASVRDSFNVNDLEQEDLTEFGSTEKAIEAHVIGFDTKNTFNGTWQTDSMWKKIFYKDLKSHQSFSGKFEMDRQVQLKEEEPRVSAISVTKTPSKTAADPGETVVCNYEVKNTGQTVISGLKLLDSAIGELGLEKTTLLPGQTTYAKTNYAITEDDFLNGSIESKITAIGTDSFGRPVRASEKSMITTKSTYYPIGLQLSGAQGNRNWTLFQGQMNLTNSNFTMYVVDVNMTQSRKPAPICPYIQWPEATALSILQFGITDGASSIWQDLNLSDGKYSGSQFYGAANGNITKGPIFTWNSTYAGSNPNGGFNCTRNPKFDTFDLKIVQKNLGPNMGMSIDSYQRIHKSTEPNEPSGKWMQIGHFDLMEESINKTALQPFIIVENMKPIDRGEISWSEIVVIDEVI